MPPARLDDDLAFLEDGANPRTRAWTAAQNERTRAELDGDPARAPLLARFDELSRIDALGVPVARGARTFRTARPAGASQGLLFVRDGDGADRALVDPLALDPSALTAIDWWFASPGGRYVAVGLSRGGDERSSLHVFDVDANRFVGEAIPDTRHCSLAWTPDESGFYYTRYPAGHEYDIRLYRHVLGCPWTEDEKVFGDGLAPEEFIATDLSPDGRRLVATVSLGWARSDVYLADTERLPLRFEPLACGRDAENVPIPGDRTLYLRTNDGAERSRVYAIDYARPERDAWREVVPEGDGAIESVVRARGALVVCDLVDVRSRVRVFRDDGTVAGPIDLGERSVLAIAASERSEDAYLVLASYLEAPQIVRLSVARETPQLETFAAVATPFDASRYRVVREAAVSKDGTVVPLSVIARADVAFDGTAPAVVYGYGGFNIALSPWFVPTIVPWLDAGGVYVVANLRGGGEFGDAWHRDGMREKKQNVFDDAVAAIERVGAARIADPERIAIVGASNGGLLAAAVAVQRPDLVRAIVSLVPVIDMLRYHLFSIGRLWIPEYGDPDVPEDAAFLRAYSPLHNVRDGTAYPAMLVRAAESDGRVDPMHARKFAARVAEASSSGLRILASIESEAGHGAGKPRAKQVAESADVWTFLFRELGVAARD